MKEHYIMSHQELSRLEVIKRVLEHRMKQSQAADHLRVSIRQVQHLVRAYRDEGVNGLLSKRRGKPSNRRISATVKEMALGIVLKHYHDFAPTLAKEKLNRASPGEIIKIETSALTDDGIKYCTVTTAWYIK